MDENNGLPDFSKMLEGVQQLQSEMQKAAERAKSIIVEAEAGAGLVKASANGEGTIVSITVDPELAKPEDLDVLQDLVRAACNRALARAREKTQEEMQKATGGLMPGGFPFGGS
jgi:DNA-binding YbaB/EbfC family protein